MNAIDTKLVETYLTAGSGWDLDLHKDGRFEISQHGTWDPDADIVASVRCCDVGNIDSEFFTEGFVMWDEDMGEYVEIESGQTVGSLKEVIAECCAAGDVTRFEDELADKFNNDQREP